jgi:polyhydroxybutyrate depolymerase
VCALACKSAGNDGGAAGAGGTGGTTGAGGSATPDADTPIDSATSDAGPDADASTPCPGGGWAAGDRTITLVHDGVNRQYVAHVPAGYTGTARVPLILVLHGAHNTPALARSWSQMDPVANANGFIVAYPAALDCWNAGSCCCGATADDVGFLRDVVTDVSSHACIDPKRVFAAGISNGGCMAHRLGCEAADVFAAEAAIACPVTVPSCKPSRPTTVVYFHGTVDATVSFSVAEPTFTGWAARDGCTGSPVETYNQGSTACRTYQTCNAGAEVAFCTITGMGHCWPEDTRCAPQPGTGVTDFKADPMMWSYFNRHPLP